MSCHIIPQAFLVLDQPTGLPSRVVQVFKHSTQLVINCSSSKAVEMYHPLPSLHINSHQNRKLEYYQLAIFQIIQHTIINGPVLALYQFYSDRKCQCRLLFRFFRADYFLCPVTGGMISWRRGR
jgi:hypothetical protein